jgi:hypothetical protein
MLFPSGVSCDCMTLTVTFLQAVVPHCNRKFTMTGWLFYDSFSVTRLYSVDDEVTIDDEL